MLTRIATKMRVSYSQVKKMARKGSGSLLFVGCAYALTIRFTPPLTWSLPLPTDRLLDRSRHSKRYKDYHLLLGPVTPMYAPSSTKT
ncbi:hypothetical protein V8E53_000950 [Lactarius tabidus]